MPRYLAPLIVFLAFGLLPTGSILADTPRGGAITGSFSEGFNDISQLAGAGWITRNNSSPLGLSGWFQGNSAVFPAQAGADSAYIAASFDSAAGLGTISNWLLTPEIALENGTRIRFWTRTDDSVDPPFPDRLEVRLSTAGGGSNVGSTAESVGTFTTALLTINPGLVNAYPIIWTQYELVLSGLAQPTTGRVGFRYYVTNSGPLGDNGTYIGIDTFSVTQPTGAGDDGIFADRFEIIEPDHARRF